MAFSITPIRNTGCFPNMEKPYDKATASRAAGPSAEQAGEQPHTKQATRLQIAEQKTANRTRTVKDVRQKRPHVAFSEKDERGLVREMMRVRLPHGQFCEMTRDAYGRIIKLVGRNWNCNNRQRHVRARSLNTGKNVAIAPFISGAGPNEMTGYLDMDAKNLRPENLLPMPFGLSPEQIMDRVQEERRKRGMPPLTAAEIVKAMRY
jgi:hypothetical protein